MPREATIAGETHREEQERYRARLRAERAPETDAADTAVTIAVYGLLKQIAAAQPRKMRKSRDEFLKRAADVLEAQDYDRDRSLAVLRRRLVRPPERFERLLGEDSDERTGLLP